MFHDPLVSSPLLPSITAVIAESPGTVYKHLLRQNLQGSRLKDKSPKKKEDMITLRLVTEYKFSKVQLQTNTGGLGLNGDVHEEHLYTSCCLQVAGQTL